MESTDTGLEFNLWLNYYLIYKELKVTCGLLTESKSTCCTAKAIIEKQPNVMTEIY